ncbi:hypothetical protein Tsubulata_006435 [Turnera subulata]|uniref:Uncharacterized protein n=1 Tax=Turnera subulata TaxID=218843 RepID=A0A9Q0JHC6_9ROSI|nr:hypothetical protein Tsubulata_006435 [Turnera subulata]
METHHKKTSSTEIFSFPSTPSPEHQDSDFEFGCLTPDSPTTDPYKNSPADHLFSNGRLLPHSFPVLHQQSTTTMLLLTDHQTISRATSRTSSISSKDSLMSSRSNSTNSSRSSVSSARTSSSDNSERRLLYYRGTKVARRTPVASRAVMAQLYGSSQRWQHIVPVPALVREDSRRKSSSGHGASVKEGPVRSKKHCERKQKKKKKRFGIWRKIFFSIFVACRHCHAMEPTIKAEMLEGNKYR